MVYVDLYSAIVAKVSDVVRGKVVNCVMCWMCTGTEVFVIGHAAWSSHYKLSATVTAGVISKLVIRHNAPVLIQVVLY